LFLNFAYLAGAGSRSNAQQMLLSQPEARAARVNDAIGLQFKHGHMLCGHDQFLT
jgi:hypothetical protein